jgi:hypothetical protein
MTQDDLYKAWHSVGADIAGLNFSDFVSYLPAQRPSLRDIKPLTYVDLRRIANQCGLGANEVSARTQATVDNYARAIEAAHGIKE